jgi:hypothetical protein
MFRRLAMVSGCAIMMLSCGLVVLDDLLFGHVLLPGEFEYSSKHNSPPT